MDKKLEEIQGKFDRIQEFNNSSKHIVMYFMGSLNRRAKLGESFEVFYNRIGAGSILSTFNEYLYFEGCNVPPILEEDVRYFYEFMRNKFNE